MRSRKVLKEDRNNKIIIVFIVLLLVLIFINSYIFFLKPFEIRILDVKFFVGDSFGIDLNNSLLTYGRVIPGSTVSRNITITNMYEFPLIVRILISKKIIDVLSVKNKQEVIQPKSTLSFPVYLNIPINYSFGEYDGKLLMEFRRR